MLMSLIVCLLLIFMFICIIYQQSNNIHFQPNDLESASQEEMLEELEQINKELRVKPFSYGLYFYKGNYLLRAKKYKEALRAYHISSVLLGNDQHVCYNKGLAYKALGQKEKAVMYFEKALQYDPQHIYAHIEIGNIAFEEKRFEDAHASFNSALNINQHNSNASLSMGILEGHLGNYQKAIYHLENSIHIKPRPFALYFLALAYMDAQRFEDSISIFNQVLAMNPEYSFIYLKRGFAYLFTDQDDAAKKDFDMAQKTLGDTPAVLLALSRYWEKSGDVDKAIDTYNQILQSDPCHVSALSGKGILLGRKGDYYKAITYFDKALTQFPHHRNSLYFRGLAKKELNLHHKALQDFLQAVEIYPHDPELNWEIASCYFNLEHYDLAFKYFNHEFTIQEFQGEAYYYCGKCCMEQGAYEEAKNYYNKAIAYGNIEANYEMGLIAYHEEKYYDAEGFLEAVIKHEPEEEDAYFYMALVKLKLEQFEQAIDYLQSAVSEAGGNETTFNLIGLSNYRLGRYETALSFFDKSINQNQESYYYPHFNKGNTLRKLKQYSEALAAYSKAIDMEPDSPYLYIGRGKLYLDLQNNDKAREDFAKAVTLKPALMNEISNTIKETTS